MEGSDKNGVIIVKKQKMKLENPFNFKAFQVFTGFGVGCGVGIGRGLPINLGAIPMIGQVMSAARGATDAFSGVSGSANHYLRKYGAKDIKVGLGCGVGFGHGYGVGIAVKPGVLHQVQSFFVQAMTTMMEKVAPNVSTTEGSLPESVQSGMSSLPNSPGIQNPFGNFSQLGKNIPDSISSGFSNLNSQTASLSKSSALHTSYGSRTEKVLDSFLKSPALKGEDRDSNRLLNDTAESLRAENNMLQLVLKHQQVIDELMAENKKLREILVEDLNIPPSKLHGSYSSRNSSSCTDCFECRRKQRKR
ncbi:uncharacterized protein LOC141670532 [Apium graveolens]|uniref:uncharacterized protein LOC141670532 n=1 Tax=Apium graveolens TaxID=4045 RepID=UPI003D7AC966